MRNQENFIFVFFSANHMALTEIVTVRTERFTGPRHHLSQPAFLLYQTTPNSLNQHQGLSM
ncbi:hypothetical protein JZ785_06025 [Alicyclobacillus curvatus]|nr:hypothetical protein JZ785_06025 [Alicyclobacillus curvatus]